MKYLLVITTICLALSCPPRAIADDVRRPTVLLFETAKGDGADKELAASTTKAVRDYLRQTQRVEVMLFDRESPTVARAIMEKKLTADKVASYSSQTERLEVAKVLSFDYAAGAEIGVKDGKVAINLWLAKVDGGNDAKWEAAGLAATAGTGSLDLDNSMQSAASSAVLDISRRAFAVLPVVKEPEPTSASSSTAISADRPPTSNQPAVGDYVAQAGESLKAGNLAVAIEQYSKAVSADPSNGALRVKLAEVYARKGMMTEAEDELNRAAAAGADKGLVQTARSRIEQSTSGRPISEPTSNPIPTAADGSKPALVTNPKSAISKIIDGDKLLSQGKPDEALDAYKESIRLNPNDWRAHERLAIVTASISLFGESRGALEQLGKLQPNPPASVAEKRYDILKTVFDAQFAVLIKQYDSGAADFDKRRLTRESYYNEIKGLSMRLESMAKFLDVLVVPAARQSANLRRSLACGLMAQAASSLLDYLETNSEKARSNAAIFAAQSKKETEAAGRLDK